MKHTDQPIDYEAWWIRWAERRRLPKSQLEMLVMLGLARHHQVGTYDMPRFLAFKAEHQLPLERAFRRLVFAGVLRYTRRKPVELGIVRGA